MDERYSRSDKLGLLINRNPEILMAMSRFGISLGFGDKTVEQVCHDQHIDCSTFLAVINFISFSLAETENVSLKSLIMYLDSAHTYFLDYCLPTIRRKLIDAIDCSGRDEIAMMILKFYDEYVEEVQTHMQYENEHVFTYVYNLLNDVLHESGFNISVFASNHHNINSKLKELKDIIVRYLPQKDNNKLNSALFDIISCEHDLVSHCRLEDIMFVPLVKKLENDIASRRPVSDGQDTTGDADSQEEQISARERDIIKWVALGLSNKEIADKLNISVNTVVTHRRNLARKLKIHSPAGLTIYAVINNIIDINNLPSV